MVRGCQVIAVFLTCVTAALAVIAPFPHGKTTVYKYRMVAKATDTEEGLYASQFVLQGTLDVTHDAEEPNLVNAYTVVLSKLTTDMHNGKNADYNEKPVLQEMDEVASVLQLPFQIIYNIDGTFQGVKFDRRESTWSWNMKKAIASMLQVDLPRINAQKLANEPLVFVSREETIHGICSVTYSVHPVDRVNANTSADFLVKKKFSPIDCAHYSSDDFSNVDRNQCNMKNDHILTQSFRDLEVEKQGQGILIKKLDAHSFDRALSANGASYPFFVITNTTFEFLRVKEKSVIPVFMKSLKMDRDLIYASPPSYMPSGARDVTLERHLINFSSLPGRLKKLLSEAVDYIESDHLSPDEINWSHARTMNKIYRTMSHMDAGALQETFRVFEDSVSRRDMEIKNIFFGVVAQVGTPAACNFTLNVILKNKIPALIAVDMLARLPMSVKVPTTLLLSEMDQLRKLDDSIPTEVRKAGILSFASLMYRTYKNSPKPESINVLQQYLKDLFDSMKNARTYEMKVTYLMAMKNVQIGRIHDVLKPVIMGDEETTHAPENFRLLAIWAIDKSAEKSFDDVRRILWSILTNRRESTKLRIAAYDILINRAPNASLVPTVHAYITKSDEENKNLIHYHYTTLDSIANTADPCKTDLRTIARSILENEYYFGSQNQHITYPLSGVQSVSYIDDEYLHAEKFDLRTIVNEFTGVPEVVEIEQETVDRYGAVSDFEIKVHIEGLEKFPTILRSNVDRRLKHNDIIDVLVNAADSQPKVKDLKIDILFIRNDRTVGFKHYERGNVSQILRDLGHYNQFMNDTDYVNYQSVSFDREYEKRLTSDVGLPIIVQSRVPTVTSIKIDHRQILRWPLSLSLDFKFKRWEHQDHSMSLYNPIKDVWHSVRAAAINEFALPFSMNISDRKLLDSLKFSFPERSAKGPSAAGLVVLGKHMVTVDEGGTQKLQESCPTCPSHLVVHDGTQPEGYYEKYRKLDFDLKHVGLNVTVFRYRGDNGYGSESYLPREAYWDRNFRSNISNSWSSAVQHGIMDARRRYKNAIFERYQNHNGGILRIEPSTDFPISEINVGLRGKHDVHDKNEKLKEMAELETWRFRATFDMISRLTKTSAVQWNFDISSQNNPGHLKNKLSVKIVRKSPEEENLKICIDASKHYPAQPDDFLMVRGTNQEIHSELTIAHGHGHDEECHRNDTLIALKLKAELSDEQKKSLERTFEMSPCNKDRKNGLFANPMNTIPITRNCLNEAIRYTTPRKYTFNMTFKMMPNTPIDHLVFSIPDSGDGWRGNLQLKAEFPMETNSLELEVVANSTEVASRSILFKNMLRDDQGPVLRPNWDFPLDNSRFDQKFLADYNDHKIRLCLVYPQIIVRGDTDPQPFSMPTDKWALISGDHFDGRFAVFAQQTRPNYLSFLVFIKHHKIYFFTRESDDVLVALADHIESEMEEDFRLPVDENFTWRLEVTKENDHFVVRMRDVSLVLRVGYNYISLVFDSGLQGHVSGLCGHLNGDKFSREFDVLSAKGIENIVIENANEYV